jgi:hypothetical protein
LLNSKNTFTFADGTNTFPSMHKIKTQDIESRIDISSGLFDGQEAQSNSHKMFQSQKQTPSRDQRKNKRQFHFTAGLLPKKSSQGRARFFVHQKQDTHNNHVAKEFDELLAGIRTDPFVKIRQNSRNNQKYEQKTYTRF